ncbi:hypothetical protein B0H13DRAFT_1914319 [Mycena leptocephala]|nr:hypothetical protein B0H13DRAFT_1914319 [Mycena leptocephala]
MLTYTSILSLFDSAPILRSVPVITRGTVDGRPVRGLEIQKTAVESTAVAVTATGGSPTCALQIEQHQHMPERQKNSVASARRKHCEGLEEKRKIHPKDGHLLGLEAITLVKVGFIAQAVHMEQRVK